MKIGRKPGCDIVLDNLSVSGEHANIFTIGEDSFIQDLGSTNGTFINNKRAAKHHLRDGDTIKIGPYALNYTQESTRTIEVDGDQDPTANDFAKTVVISAGEPLASRAAKGGPAAPEAGARNDRAPAALFVMSGKNRGRRIELTKTVTNLGKTGRPAGVIRRTADGYVLRAVDEGKKPKVNGRTVGTDGANLRNGDIIEVAGTRLQFYLK